MTDPHARLTARSVLRTVLVGVATLLTAPLWAMARLQCTLTGGEGVFAACSELLSLVPGKPELVIERLANPELWRPGLLVATRRLQGSLARRCSDTLVSSARLFGKSAATLLLLVLRCSCRFDMRYRDDELL